MMTLQPGRVSVITPCFNSGRWLEEAVASVAAQTHPDVEHLVVDDGSDDPATLAVLARLEEAGVRVLRVPHGGVSRARNAGIALATGEFLQPLDADDLLEPESCALGIATLRRHPDAVLAAGDAVVFGITQATYRARVDSLGAFFYDHAVLQPLMRTDAVRAVGGYAETMDYGEDIDLYVRLWARGDAALIGQQVFRYRTHPHQTTRDRATRESRARADIMRRHLDLYREHATDFWTPLLAEARLLDHFEQRYGRLDALRRRLRGRRAR